MPSNPQLNQELNSSQPKKSQGFYEDDEEEEYIQNNNNNHNNNNVNNNVINSSIHNHLHSLHLTINHKKKRRDLIRNSLSSTSSSSSFSSNSSIKEEDDEDDEDYLHDQDDKSQENDERDDENNQKDTLKSLNNSSEQTTTTLPSISITEEKNEEMTQENGTISRVSFRVSSDIPPFKSFIIKEEENEKMGRSSIEMKKMVPESIIIESDLLQNSSPSSSIQNEEVEERKRHSLEEEEDLSIHSIQVKGDSIINPNISISRELSDDQVFLSRSDSGSFTGLSSSKAKEILINQLEEMRDSKTGRMDTNWREEWVKVAYCIAIFIISVLLPLSFLISPHRRRSFLAESILGFCFFIFHSVFFYWQRRRRSRQWITKFNDNLEYFKSNGDPFSKLNVEHGTLNKSARMISVLRDSNWKKIPLNSIVEGDIIGLLYNEAAFTTLESIDLSKDEIITLEEGEIFQKRMEKEHLTDSKEKKQNELISITKRVKFIVKATPILHKLESTFELANEREKRFTPFQKSLKHTLKWTFIYLITSVLISIVISFVRYFGSQEDETDRNQMERYEREGWIVFFFVRTAYLCIPLSQFAFPYFYYLSNALSNAWILSFYYALQNSSSNFSIDENANNNKEKPNEGVESSSSSNTNTSHSNGKESDLERQNKLEFDPVVTIKSIWKHFIAITLRSSFLHSKRIVETLGSVTVVCNTDKDGILSDAMTQPERIFIYQGLNKGGDDGGLILDLSKVPTFQRQKLGGGEESAMQFDDKDWQRHISSLKPLGLNFLLNRGCKKVRDLVSEAKASPATIDLQCLVEREDPNGNCNQCLCNLGHEIGFSDNAIQSFVRLREIDSFRPRLSHKKESEKKEKNDERQRLLMSEEENGIPKGKHISHGDNFMRSLVVEESSSKSFQLLSKGGVQFVLDHCTAFWDGESVKQMTEIDREIIQTCHKKWNGCETIAYAYRPIDSYFSEIFKEDEEIHHEMSDANSMKGLKGMESPMCSIHLHKNKSLNDLITIEDRSAINSPSTIDPSRNNTLALRKHIHRTRLGRNSLRPQNIASNPNSLHLKDRLMVSAPAVSPSEASFMEDEGQDPDEMFQMLQKDQIFIGMIAARQYPKLFMHKNVEYLREAGVRFVLFVPEDEDIVTFFVDKLGLETDWNCCISLRDLEEGEEEDPLENPAHLPKGISAIRQHLEDDIDNVPLLVPLFSNSTSVATREMVQIFQENGEVVCCFGSALDGDKSEIFAQADISFSMEPSLRMCMDENSGDQEDSYPLISSAHYLEKSSSKSFSCDMNSVATSFVMHRKSGLFDICKMIQHGRHSLVNLKSCVVMYQYCCVLLHVLLLLSFILFNSKVFILNGYQLIWLVCIIFPILAFPLLFMKRDEDTMSTIPPKNILEFKRLRRLVFVLGIRVAFNVLISSVIFIWSLFRLWPNSSWSRIFGFDPTVDYRSTLFEDALIYSQNILLFAIVFHLSIGSISLLYRHKSVLRTRFQIPLVYPICFFCGISLQVVFFIISVRNHPMLLDQLGWYIYLLIFLWPAVALAIDEGLKVREREWFQRYQKGLKLEFDTRLGRYSPK
eukprot:TRINITY_DN2044_c0_g1_i4.p1 TRINITY_DN2044_c0_g1~~TRINITY_DN2044_c0_g1_i4.p1  ORF type:complete len:1569 (-),score=567.37 TRINITY_DN2044_c0_g1_i4:1041-5747(-)